MIDLFKPVAIAKDLYWVGLGNSPKYLYCNPYLYIAGETGILFDPGSALDGEIVLEKVQSLIPLSHLEAIVCSHQDPDLCMAIPIFEKAGFKGVVCCHERAAILIQYYGIKSSFYLVNHHQFSYTMQCGTSFGFIFSPYLHFAGAIMSYLPEQQVLISGDLFGSVTADWHLYAEKDYLDGMIAFHEVYMPSHDILASTMELLDSYPLTMICPQHGSILRSTLIAEAIETLKTIPCGLFSESTSKKLQDEGGITLLLDQVITRLITIHGTEKIRELFKHSPFTVNTKLQKLTKYSISEDTLWETFFRFLREQNTGLQYLTSISSMVERLSKEYDLPLPESLSSVLFRTQLEAEESRAQVQQLQKQLQELEEDLHRDPITKLYNQDFYLARLKQELSDIPLVGKGITSYVLNIDNLDRINLDFGSTEGDKTLRLLADLLRDYVDPQVQVCRIGGSSFALLCTTMSKEEVLSRATQLKNRIHEEDRFIVPINVSMGIFHSSEIPRELYKDPEQMALLVNQVTLLRVRLAKKQGGGIVSASTSDASSSAAFTILLVDKPGVFRDLVRQTLEKRSFHVLTADNGLDAKNQILSEAIDLILCELYVQKLSGLTLRKQLISTPSAGNIPFILMAENKQEQTVKQAYELGIRHFFSRPIALYELVGLIEIIAKKGV
ncbi:MAG: diguanylate cyclase domain-containing protein [Sphaerochaetaceae bacterium]